MSSRGARNAYLRQKHIMIIQDFCDRSGLEWHYVHGYEWHIRIDNVLDVFPTRKRWHCLITDHRGSFSDYEELQDIYFKEVV